MPDFFIAEIFKGFFVWQGKEIAGIIIRFQGFCNAARQEKLHCTSYLK